VVELDTATPDTRADAIPIRVAISLGVSAAATPVLTDGTTSITTAPHEDEPPHTPQLSSACVQQTPEGGRAAAQHTPCASTTNPVPLHTPQASTTPPVQHTPCRSVAVPLPQHRPVTASTAAVQHSPAESRVPPTHAGAPARCTSGTSHWTPAQPGLHTHVSAWQWVFGAVHGAVEAAHVQAGPAITTHCSEAAGVPSPRWVHRVGAAGRPSPPTQVTLRLRVPNCTPQGAETAPGVAPLDTTGDRDGVGEALAAVQADQAPTSHAARSVGHRNVLQSRTVLGAGSCAHTRLDTWASCPLDCTYMHNAASSAVDTPGPASGPTPDASLMQGFEQADHRRGGRQYAGGQGSASHGSTAAGFSSGGQLLSSKLVVVPTTVHRTSRVRTPPTPHTTEHVDQGPGCQRYRGTGLALALTDADIDTVREGDVGTEAVVATTAELDGVLVADAALEEDVRELPVSDTVADAVNEADAVADDDSDELPVSDTVADAVNEADAVADDDGDELPVSDTVADAVNEAVLVGLLVGDGLGDGLQPVTTADVMPLPVCGRAQDIMPHRTTPQNLKPFPSRAQIVP
jgi:hypothetical protein